MATGDDPPESGPPRARAAGAGGAAGQEAAPLARASAARNLWARQGWMAVQESHTLSTPLARWMPEPVEVDPAASPPGAESGPPVAIPEPVLYPRQPQRLPEDAVCRSPIAGRVIAVMAAAGQTVARHQPVLVIEAMKMENRVGPEVDGVLKAVHVSAGDAVRAGQVLFELV